LRPQAPDRPPLDAARPDASGGEPAPGAAPAGRRTLESVAASDAISEALDLARAEEERLQACFVSILSLFKGLRVLLPACGIVAEY
jgi:hypothetical protein